MIQKNKSSLIKLLILILLTFKIGDVMYNNLSNIGTDKVISLSLDEIENEIELETAFFQKSTKGSFYTSDKIFSVKAPIIKDTFSYKTYLIEFTTPPPEYTT